MYSHLPYFLCIAAMLCYSKDEEFFNEDLFWACLFLLLRPLGLVISFI
jgi:hypothetical protein